MNQILDSLDKFLLSQKESEQKIFFFLPILLFGFLSYYFLYPVSNAKLNSSISKNKDLKRNIQGVTISNNTLKISNISTKNNIKKMDKELKKLNLQKTEIENLTKKLVIFKFDLPKWADFYNKIPNLAKKYRLFIINLDNKMLEDKSNSLVRKKMEIKIEAYGNFVDFIRFINEFESKKALIKVQKIDIESNKMSVVFDIYGAKL